MKKIKKAKLWKIIGLMTGGLAIIATPIITTACSSNSSSNNGGNNGGTGGSGSGGDSSGSGGSSSGDVSQKKDVVFNDSVDIIGNPDKIFTNPKEGIEDILNANKEKIIKNYTDIKGDLTDSKITVELKNNEEDLWGTIGYDQWNKKTFADDQNNLEKIYYPNKMTFFTINSKNDLYNQISDKLSEKLKQIDSDKFSSITKANIVKNTNLGYSKDDNLLHINVETTTDGIETIKYDLCLPTSDIDINIINLKTTINGNKINSVTKDNLNFTFEVGINSKNEAFNYNENVIFDVSKPKPTYDEMLKQMGWEDIKEDGKLNSQKISEITGIYNVTFSKGDFIEEDSRELSPNKKSLTIKAVPNQNYYWEDGTNKEKVITISNVGFLQKNAEIKLTEEKWTVWGLQVEDVNSPDKYVKNNIDQIISDFSNAQTVVPKLINVKLVYESYNANETLFNSNQKQAKSGKLILKPVALPGYLLKDGEETKKITITLKLTTENKPN